MVTIDWRLSPHALPLHRPLRTAKGTISERQVWLLEAQGEGVCGRGEASPLPGFGGEDPERCVAALETIPQDPRAALAYADQLEAHSPCAASAIRGALAERSARARGLPLARQLAAALSAQPVARLRCNALLPEPDVAMAQELQQQGFTAFKWKSSGESERDAQHCRQLREALGPAVKLRLDANGSWDLPAARRFAEAVQDLDLDYVEQPLPVGEEAALSELTPLRLRVALDESLSSMATIAQVLEQCWAEVLVIKMQWLGGFPALRRIITMARARHPRRVVVSSTLDSAIGRAHALHAAAALELEHEHHGLASGSLFSHDLAADPVVNGSWRLGAAPGLGLHDPQ